MCSTCAYFSEIFNNRILGLYTCSRSGTWTGEPDCPLLPGNFAIPCIAPCLGCQRFLPHNSCTYETQSCRAALVTWFIHHIYFTFHIVMCVQECFYLVVNSHTAWPLQHAIYILSLFPVPPVVCLFILTLTSYFVKNKFCSPRTICLRCFPLFPFSMYSSCEMMHIWPIPLTHLPNMILPISSKL